MLLLRRLLVLLLLRLLLVKLLLLLILKLIATTTRPSSPATTTTSTHNTLSKNTCTIAVTPILTILIMVKRSTSSKIYTVLWDYFLFLLKLTVFFCTHGWCGRGVHGGILFRSRWFFMTTIVQSLKKIPGFAKIKTQRKVSVKSEITTQFTDLILVPKAKIVPIF